MDHQNVDHMCEHFLVHDRKRTTASPRIVCQLVGA